MRIDLHLHTSAFSNCGKQTPDELLRTARDAGLDGLVITDHSAGYRIWPADQWADLQRKARKHGLRLFAGVEVGCLGGFDYLVYGSLDFLAAEKLHEGKYLEPEDLIEMAHRAGCFVAIAHPYRREDDLVPPRVYKLALDGVEVKSFNMKTELQQARGMALAKAMDCVPIAGSDAHIQIRVGGFGVELKNRVEDERELVAALQAGEFRIFTEDGRACRTACQRQPCEDCTAIA